ncbi:MAG TPA: glucose-methanol-choline oxidoreductase [Acidobacteria bacterium]|nr:glucose-methanol-choline oxidoreductase [Acidobacteriota bacterium]
MGDPAGSGPGSTRRTFLQQAALTVPALGVLPRLAAGLPRDTGDAPREAASVAPAEADCEYIVVGSGAGGGTLAARLAEEGRRVVLLEAGGDPREIAGDRLPEDYDVPVFHGLAAENPGMKWDFFVRHYASREQQERDPKYCAEWEGRPVDGVLYPRAGTLGGCTAHNAMIFIAPHNADWDGIAELTGDPSWRADRMRTYFERLENCHHRMPRYRWLSKLGINPTRHGFNGWLQTEKALPLSALRDKKLVEVLQDSLKVAFRATATRGERDLWTLQGQGDPNDWRLVRKNATGVCYTPLSTRGHQRMGARERVVETARKYPDRLKIVLHALVTRVLFDDGNRAVGVEYLHGERLYRAAAGPHPENGERREIRASREVILAGGAFNTPQLLMLSGIGPRATLERHGIPVRVDLPGVGRNLQDRYEVGVVHRMKSDWEMLACARFAKGDPQYEEWARSRSGVYATNGAMLAAIKRSAPERPLPDLFCFALLGLFKGYFPNYSRLFAEHLNYLTWAVLKAHTVNRAGEVTLRSADPRDVPEINFHYFEEGSDRQGEDLDSVVAGIRFVRTLTAELKKQKLIVAEELPGEHVQSDDELRDFVRREAWGHHASCSCPIGAKEQGGCLSSDFRVHGTSGLRVVDASVFPRIPGLFIVSAVYMIGEKAADVILAEAARGQPSAKGVDL